MELDFYERVKSRFKKLVFGRWTSVPDPCNHPQVTVGRHTYGLGPFTVSIHATCDQVHIGSFCSIARDVKIIASGEHYWERVSTFPFACNLLNEGADRDTRTRGPIVIGHDNWIGTGAVILSGVRTGNGAVIAAGAVVTGKVDDFAVVGGIPAKLIRYRFSEKQRKWLLGISWWEWPDELLLSRLEDFYGSVEDFIDKYGKKEVE